MYFGGSFDCARRYFLSAESENFNTTENFTILNINLKKKNFFLENFDSPKLKASADNNFA